MARLLIYGLGLACAVVAMFISDTDGASFTVSSGLAIGFAIPLIDALIAQWRYLKIVWYGIRTIRGRVRVSASYLYRIQVDNDYLLVKGKRFDQYQPVGGVYKTHPSSFGKRHELGVLNDNLLVPDEVSEGDLRVRVPGRNLLRFVRWFETERGRETDGGREFYEELIATGLLPDSVFRVVKYDRISRYYHPLRYSRWAESQELLIADTLELIPTHDQLVALRRLKAVPDTRILWASERQIRRSGATDGLPDQRINIAQTAVWTIDAENEVSH